jgi:hypothetical protein
MKGNAAILPITGTSVLSFKMFLVTCTMCAIRSPQGAGRVKSVPHVELFSGLPTFGKLEPISVLICQKSALRASGSVGMMYTINPTTGRVRLWKSFV